MKDDNDIDNNLQDSESKGKSKKTSLVARIPENEQWIVTELDRLAAKQDRSRSYVALKLLGKILGLNKEDETL